MELNSMQGKPIRTRTYRSCVISVDFHRPKTAKKIREPYTC